MDAGPKPTRRLDPQQLDSEPESCNKLRMFNRDVAWHGGCSAPEGQRGHVQKTAPHWPCSHLQFGPRTGKAANPKQHCALPSAPTPHYQPRHPRTHNFPDKRTHTNSIAHRCTQTHTCRPCALTLTRTRTHKRAHTRAHAHTRTGTHARHDAPHTTHTHTTDNTSTHTHTHTQPHTSAPHPQPACTHTRGKTSSRPSHSSTTRAVTHARTHTHTHTLTRTNLITPKQSTAHPSNIPT
jgi:hypothetical protein